MESPTVTVPTTQVYYHRETGVGLRMEAGDVVTQRKAWLYQVAGATEPIGPSGLVAAISDPQDGDTLVYDAGSGTWINAEASGGGDGPATIHNYFPDGAIHSAALIDTEGDQDFNTKLWYGQRGTETLTHRAVSGDTPAAVLIELAGGGLWNEGFVAADWQNTWGCGALPAGRYRVAFDIELTQGDPFVARVSPYSESALLAMWHDEPVLVDSVRRRIVLDCALSSPSLLGLQLMATERDNVFIGETPPAATIAVSRVMVTEGDPAFFRDGDGDGWSWSGTAHASASSGPQP